VGGCCWLGSGWLKERSDSGGGVIGVDSGGEREDHDHGMGLGVFGHRIE